MRVTLALLVAQGLLQRSRAPDLQQSARKDWLWKMATDALDLTRPQRVHGLDLATAFGTKPLEQSDPSFLLAHRDWLELVPASERPKLRVAAMRREAYVSMFAGLEWLCLSSPARLRPADSRNLSNLRAWVLPLAQQEFPEEVAAVESFFSRLPSGRN